MIYRHITFQESQKCAITLLKKYKLENEQIPIDPEILIRRIEYNNEARIKVIPKARLHADYHLWGMVAYILEPDKNPNKGFQIYIDQAHYFGDKRKSLLTLGEELGHIVLHLEFGRVLPDVADGWNHLSEVNCQNHKNRESQARLFGSNIILPPNSFDPFVFDWVEKNKALILSSGCQSMDELASTISINLANVIEVSESIIKITLKRWPNQLLGQINDRFNFV